MTLSFLGIDVYALLFQYMEKTWIFKNVLKLCLLCTYCSMYNLHVHREGVGITLVIFLLSCMLWVNALKYRE